MTRFLLAVLFAFASAGAAAQELRVGLGSEPTAMDPHYHNLSPNNSLLSHIFESLVGQDERQRLTPDLAESWKAIDATTWEFKLRRNVRFHDGTPFTADDVVFSFERAPNVEGSPSSFGIYARGKTFVRVDDHTVHVKTAAPYPLMPNDLSQVFIVSRKHGQGAKTPDYNSGKAAIGTGPYRFAEYTPGNRIVVQRNEQYWGEKPAWQRVIFRGIKSDPSRVAALLAGDVDLIEQVPAVDLERLKKDPKLTISQTVSNRIIYLHLDHFRDDSPFVRAKDGGPIKNPLRDLRVRKAVSMAIDRDAIVSRVMEGQAIKAGQLLPEGFFGVSPKLRPVAFDPNGAKKLLAEAGVPNGFRLTIHSPNDRYPNDAKIAEAVGQMLSRIGIDTQVVTLTQSVFFREASTGSPEKGPKFSFILVGWGSGTGEASSPLKSLIATFDREKGMGASNRGRYSNAQVDRMINDALATVDDVKRSDLLARATEVAIEDVGIIPLHYQVNTWAMRRGFAYKPRTDEYTLATGVGKAN
ncbi:MAG TPA: ABC transporter substrate-binding protein [Burkholderiales bacterium]|nr:ABC transporter substrate-binding protein [Burkholderiales bacterium]